MGAFFSHMEAIYVDLLRLPFLEVEYVVGWDVSWLVHCISKRMIRNEYKFFSIIGLALDTLPSTKRNGKTNLIRNSKRWIIFKISQIYI